MESQELSGNNAMTAEDRNAMLASLKADVEQTEAQLAQATQDPTPQATADTTAQVQSESTPPTEAKAPEGKKDSLQQFRDKSGEVSEDKIQQATEHLRKSTQDKEARLNALLTEYKDLQKKYTQVSQGLKQVEAQAPAPAVAKPDPFQGIETNDISPEFEQAILKDLEVSPAKTLVKLARAIAQQEADRRLNPIQADLEGIKESSVDQMRRKELDSIVADGHEWVLTDGLGRFDKVFQERPYLLHSKTPYKDALRFMDDVPSGNGTAARSAQTGPKTPILSANGAVPPPSSVPTVSAESQYAALESEFDRAMELGDYRKAREIERKMASVLGVRR